MLALRVTAGFEPKIRDGLIAVEDIQDCVEKVLSEAGYADLICEEFERQTSGMSEEEKAIRMKGVQYEMDAIASTGMSDYFLLDHEIVRRAVEKGGVITKTGRGSAPSYYTNSLLGLSSIDRFAIPVEMFPDRFISADRMRDKKKEVANTINQTMISLFSESKGGGKL